MVAHMMMVPVTARLGSVGGENDRGGDRDKPEEASSRNTRGSQVCAKHELPHSPISALITGS